VKAARWPSLRSVRWRLTLGHSIALGLILLAYAAFVFTFLRARLLRELDHHLQEEIEEAEERLEPTDEGALRWRGRYHPDEQEAPAAERWLEVWSLAGDILLRAPAPRALGLSAPAASGSSARTLALEGDVSVRVLEGRTSIAGVPVVVRAARSTTPMDRALGRLLLVLGLGIPAALLASLAFGYVLARRALDPVERMTERARTITAEHLSDRLPVVNPDDELGALATTFNETFARLERSFEQLRRFTADASHELRTPLTAIRSVGEVGLSRPRDAFGYREVIGSMLEEVDRLTRLVETLLAFSRAEAGQLRLRVEPVDLAELSRDVAGHLGVLAEEKGQSLAVEAEGPVPARADRAVLRQALVNLVDNAIKHSPAGQPIRVVARASDVSSVVDVIDRGPGIAPEHRSRLFERFYRVDEARSRETGGLGLGLALAEWGVRSAGGRIEVETVVGAGSTFRIVLPRAQAPADGVETRT
jgi:heavy metal sensor kinase